jgi:prephenate dehydrogenase
MIENRAALADVLREAEQSLRDMLVILEDSDNEELLDYLVEVKATRDEVS